jgi:hypothetical protein
MMCNLVLVECCLVTGEDGDFAKHKGCSHGYPALVKKTESRAWLFSA